MISQGDIAACVFILGGYAVSDDGHKDGDDTCAEGAGEPCDGEYVASDDGVVRHAGRQTPIGDIRNGINNAPKNVNNGNDDKVVFDFASKTGRKQAIVMNAMGNAIHLR